MVVVETFVDPEYFRGTTYKVSGWSELGSTSGWGRCAQDFYQPHERSKQLWVKELVKGACQKLRAAHLPPAWAGVEARAPVRCATPVREIGSLLSQCQALPEFRRRQALAYPVAGMRALIVLASLCAASATWRPLPAASRSASCRAWASGVTGARGGCAVRARRPSFGCWAGWAKTKWKRCCYGGRTNGSARCRTP